MRFVLGIGKDERNAEDQTDVGGGGTKGVADA